MATAATFATKNWSIWDLDNCLSNDIDRIPLIDWTATNPEDRYREYHAAGHKDAPGNLATFQRVSLQTNPVFLTARPVIHREATRRWLEEHLNISNPILIMRNNGDHAPSVLLKRRMLDHLEEYGVSRKNIERAYDDRKDIVEMYKECGIPAFQLMIHETCAYTPPPKAAVEQTPAKKTAADILGEMADTYRERNKVYGDNFRRVGHVLQALHPEGVDMNSALDHEVYHLWSLLIVKASRFAVSKLSHQDSIHDLAIYAAMIESIIQERAKK